MTESLEELFLFGEEKMEKAIAQLQKEFGSIRTGRANPGILDKVIVEYYGALTPLKTNVTFLFRTVQPLYYTV